MDPQMLEAFQPESPCTLGGSLAGFIPFLLHTRRYLLLSHRILTGAAPLAVIAVGAGSVVTRDALDR